jgi:pimeloyl-ACP methyl ester carboxylesterase
MPPSAAQRRILALSDGRSLEIFVSGSERDIPLVFHHGTPGMGGPYPPFLDVAADRGLRSVSYTRAGYGGSSRREGRGVADVAADVGAILDDLGAERCYTVGWSGGGPHALATARLIPERVIAAATIAGVGPYGVDGLDFMDGMGVENVAEFGAAVAGPNELRTFLEREGSWVRTVTAAQIIEGFGDLISDVDRQALTGEYAEWLASTFREAVRPGIWGWYDDDLAFTRSWGFDIGSISRPVAVWQGDEDRMVPFAHGQWLAAHVGSARVHLMPGHGHLSLAAASMEMILDDLLTLGT